MKVDRGLTRQELEAARERLLAHRRRAEAMHGRIAGELSVARTRSTGELSAYDNHTSDAGLESFERGKDLALADTYRGILQEIDAALERVEAGTYGLCTRCGRRIEPGRLEAIPWAPRCARCQAEVEGVEAGPRRPVEEELLDPAFSRTFDAGEGNPRYDGEDAWQEVARYGNANSPQDIPGAVGYGDAFLDADEPVGAVTPVEGIPDLGEKGVTDWDTLYPDPVEDDARRPGPAERRPRAPRPGKRGWAGR